MKKTLLLLSMILFFTLSCDDDEVKPDPVTYFTLEVDASYITDATDNWVILHTSDGDVLDVKPFESGDKLVFDSTVVITDKIGVTFINASFYAGKTFNISSYLGVDPQEQWVLRTSYFNFNQGSLEGELNVTITDPNLGSHYDAILSSKMSGSTASPAMTDPAIEFAPFNIYSGLNDVFIFVTDNNGLPKFKFLENVEPGSIDYSLADMDAFDNVQTINFPLSSSQFLSVQAFEEDTDVNYSGGFYVNFYLSGIINGSQRDKYNIGYLNRFSKYRTFLNSTYNGYSIGYEAYGAAPTSPINLSNSLGVTITNESVKNFAVSSPDFDWRTTTWSYGNQQTSVNWNVSSDNAHFTNLPNFPEVITTRYPEINMDALQHNQTLFYKGNRSYRKFLDENFKGASLEPFELNFKIIY